MPDFGRRMADSDLFGKIWHPDRPRYLDGLDAPASLVVTSGAREAVNFTFENNAIRSHQARALGPSQVRC
jgi:hypothetical protein